MPGEEILPAQGHPQAPQGLEGSEVMIQREFRVVSSVSLPLGRWPLPYLSLFTTLGSLPCVLTGLRLLGTAGVSAHPP